MGRYVEKHALEDVEGSLAFIYQLTKRFTGEFAIRPLLAADPKKIMAVLWEWPKDESVHVRRLASECLRIRLPWASRLYVALEEFESYQAILTNLNRDPSKFVQKSVGNNLNDLMKEKPELARKIISSWLSDNPDPDKTTLWIINHGLRSARKKEPKALKQQK